MHITIVDSKISLIALLDSIENLPANPPSLYFDLEGVNLSRYGSISIVQLFVLPVDHTYLIDVHTLHRDAFYTVNAAGKSLKFILESEQVPKVFFDVRNDSDALFGHFQVRLSGVRDVQLMEVATRSFSKRLLSGLAACIERDAVLTIEEKDAWKATKQSGSALFAPEHGGSYEVFNVRPIPLEIISYCAQDVAVLPSLWLVYSDRLSSKWAEKVLVETGKRVRISQSVSYDPKGKEKALSPWGQPPAKKKSTQQVKTATQDCTLGSPSLRRVFESELIRPQEPNSGPPREPSAETGLPSSLSIHNRVPCLAERPSVLQSTPTAAAPNSSRNRKPRIDNQPDKTHKRYATTPVIPPEQKTAHSTSIINPSSYWTCGLCSRKMLASQKEAPLEGKPHTKNLKTQSTIRTPNPIVDIPTSSKQIKPASETAAPKRKNNRYPTPKASAGVFLPSRQIPTTSKPPKSKTTLSTTSSRLVATGPPPSYSVYDPKYMSGTAYGTSYMIDDQDWGLCDKDCGWCGHCMDGANF